MRNFITELPFMSLLANITFLDVCVTLVTIAVAERLIIQYLPESLVGPNGRLLKTNG